MASAARASSPGRRPGVTLADVKAQRRDEAERAAAMLGAEIEFFDAGDYPLRTTEAPCSTG
jgi:4-oxalomesaconate hydratase